MGVPVGTFDGGMDGTKDGKSEGAAEGMLDGIIGEALGKPDGCRVDGAIEGGKVGPTLGNAVAVGANDSEGKCETDGIALGTLDKEGASDIVGGCEYDGFELGSLEGAREKDGANETVGAVVRRGWEGIFTTIFSPKFPRTLCVTLRSMKTSILPFTKPFPPVSLTIIL